MFNVKNKRKKAFFEALDVIKEAVQDGCVLDDMSHGPCSLLIYEDGAVAVYPHGLDFVGGGDREGIFNFACQLSGEIQYQHPKEVLKEKIKLFDSRINDLQEQLENIKEEKEKVVNKLNCKEI